MLGQDVWAFVVVGGFIILAIAIGYAKFRNKGASADEPVGGRRAPPHFNDRVDPNDVE